MVEIQLEPGLFDANQECPQYLRVKPNCDLLLLSSRYYLLCFLFGRRSFSRRSVLVIVQESRNGGSRRLCDHSGRDQGQEDQALWYEAPSALKYFPKEFLRF